MAPIGAFISGCAGTSLSEEETSFFRETSPWGLIVFKRNCETPEQLKALTSAFRAAVGRKNAPVFVDQEGGRVQRLGPPSNSWRKYPAASKFGELFTSNPLAALRAARNVGRLMADDLTAAGITVNCLPVLDVPQPEANAIISDRAYGEKYEAIVSLARAHLSGFLQGGILPVIKHIPGHGRAKADSHLSLPVVEASAADLRTVDFPPFAAFADLPMAMTAHVVFMAFDKQNPATLSAKVIKKVIRQEIGFQGLLMSDDLSMKALDGSFSQRTSRALGAGCDIVLHCNGNMAEMAEVAAAAGKLRGRAMRRARLALKWGRKPESFDRKTALKDLDTLNS